MAMGFLIVVGAVILLLFLGALAIVAFRGKDKE